LHNLSGGSQAAQGVSVPEMPSASRRRRGPAGADWCSYAWERGAVESMDKLARGSTAGKRTVLCLGLVRNRATPPNMSSCSWANQEPRPAILRYRLATARACLNFAVVTLEHGGELGHGQLHSRGPRQFSQSLARSWSARSWASWGTFCLLASASPRHTSSSVGPRTGTPTGRPSRPASPSETSMAENCRFRTRPPVAPHPPSHQHEAA
jgi:hypothetical protein